MNDYNTAASGVSKNNILGPDLGIDLVTGYDKYCLYDAAQDAYFKILKFWSGGLSGGVDYRITWVDDFGDSSVIVDMYLERIQKALRRVVIGEGLLPTDAPIDRRLIQDIVSRYDDLSSLDHLQLIPLLFTVRDKSLINAVGANFALSEPLLRI